MRTFVPDLHAIYQQYKHAYDFVCVYIMEAHAMDEWPISSPRGSVDGKPINIKQPKSIEQRLALADKFVADYKFEIPMVVDPMDNSFDEVFCAWPFRFYTVKDGKLAFKAQPHKAQYDLNHLRAWIEAEEALKMQ